MIEIGVHCIKVIDWVEEDLKSYLNDTLDLLFYRGEFRLVNMSLSGITDKTRI